MPPKRAAEDDSSTSSNFRDRKKQKLTEARTIPVQHSNGNAGPSTVRFGPLVHDSMRNLPGAIDVEKFAESRAYEINAMQSAMKSASSSSTHRAWQVLPRHLRRRAASHDPRRVPVRLRAKAKAEMDPVKKKALGRSLPKLGKSKRLARSEALLKRQRDKRWLETHIWHAKRMHMDNMWGYRLAVTPTEKSFRPSHRASYHHAILHDASYMGLIEMKGPEEVLKTILGMLCDCQGVSPTSKRFTGGSRALDTDFYEPGMYPFKLIGPVTIMWRPPPPQQEQAPDPKQKTGKQKGKGKSKEKEPSVEAKTAWIRCHPGLFDDVFSALRTATSLTLCGMLETEVELADLRGAISMLEVMGPKASQVMKGALSPVMEGKEEEFKTFWNVLGNLQTPGTLPRNMVVGFTVQDPRLKFPPKNASIQFSSPTTSNTFTYPTSALARSTLWDESARMKLRQPRFKKKDLDERRARNIVPGKPLSALRQDDRVPVILIQRSVENTEQDTESVHGYTLMFPAGWSMAFLPSLIHTGTRVGGQRERAYQAFEAGKPYFPRDFPGNKLYDAYAKEREEEEKAKWQRTPPAKRVNYEKLGTRSPWKADWEVVLGFAARAQNVGEQDLVSTQREPGAEGAMEIDSSSSSESYGESPESAPWVARGDELLRALLATEVRDAATVLYGTIEKYREKRSLGALPPQVTPEMLLKRALITVKISPCGRGSPSDLAIIYSVSEVEMKDAVLPDRTISHKASELTTSPGDAVIGYVTTGGFSLSRGEGFAIGSMSFSKFLELKCLMDRDSTRKDERGVLVKVRARNGQQCRLSIVTPLP
ncbi:Ribonucleases P/MRP protein subunit pop1 [Marasmius tenuissimus]|uniref:Ribonucleases P/MRP protein subunit pop1 n=1 Tax=Marasmius tenuissimus TaxID=585030 RepID=A0ABR2ZV72_9AGAR|nr:Ribonucleases P/MRP protein subunit pop1 [Marasmius tenuissimus]